MNVHMISRFELEASFVLQIFVNKGHAVVQLFHEMRSTLTGVLILVGNKQFNSAESTVFPNGGYTTLRFKLTDQK